MKSIGNFQLVALLASTLGLSSFCGVNADVLLDGTTKISSEQVVSSPENLLVDPISGAVKGTVDNYGITRNTDRNVCAARNFKGFLVVDPTTNRLKGFIGQDEQLIKFDLGTARNYLAVGTTPSRFIVDPMTGQLRGFIDTNGKWFDVSGVALPTLSNEYVVVNPTEGQLTGFIVNGRLVSSSLSTPDVYRRTTIVTKDSNGEISRTTTTTTTAPSAVLTTKLVLPSTSTYIAVNPISGAIMGIIDPTTLMVNGSVIPNGYIVVDRHSGTVFAVVSPSGELVAMNVTPLNNTFAASIDSERVELSRTIAQALVKGRLSTSQAAQLQATLDKIPSSYEINELTYAQAMPLVDLLGSVREELITIANVEPTVPIIGSSFIVVNGELQWADEIATRRIELRRRINNEFIAGHIDSTQMVKLNNEMDRIAALESSYRLRHNDVFTNEESRSLFVAYDHVGSQLDHAVASNKHSGNIGER